MKDVEVGDGYSEGVKEHMGARGDISSIYGAVWKENGWKLKMSELYVSQKPWFLKSNSVSRMHHPKRRAMQSFRHL